MRAPESEQERDRLSQRDTKRDPKRGREGGTEGWIRVEEEYLEYGDNCAKRRQDERGGTLEREREREKFERGEETRPPSLPPSSAFSSCPWAVIIDWSR